MPNLTTKIKNQGEFTPLKIKIKKILENGISKNQSQKMKMIQFNIDFSHQKNFKKKFIKRKLKQMLVLNNLKVKNSLMRYFLLCSSNNNKLNLKMKMFIQQKINSLKILRNRLKTAH